MGMSYTCRPDKFPSHSPFNSLLTSDWKEINCERPVVFPERFNLCMVLLSLEPIRTGNMAFYTRVLTVVICSKRITCEPFLSSHIKLRGRGVVKRPCLRSWRVCCRRLCCGNQCCRGKWDWGCGSLLKKPTCKIE